VVLVTDGGAHRHAARRPVLGADRVSRFLLNLARRVGVPPIHTARLNAGPALVIDDPGGPIVVAGDACGGVVVRLWVQLNPAKLEALDQPVDLV
jgi:RNA polymerase sigma-70 factor (ECF subfamily)